VIIWLNGTFGCGKTSTAAELRSLIPSSRLFDPETVGYMLRPNLTDHPVSDFQHWPPWRPLVVAAATELARFTEQHLIAPQTILARAYLEEIFAGLCDAGQAVFHVVSRRRRAHTAPAHPRLARSTGLAPGSPGRVPGVALVDDPGSRLRRGHGMLDPI
jgi:hypothetical protein